MTLGFVTKKGRVYSLPFTDMAAAIRFSRYLAFNSQVANFWWE